MTKPIRSKKRPILNFGIIGLGGGASDMVPVLAQHPQIKITAAADVGNLHVLVDPDTRIYGRRAA